MTEEIYEGHEIPIYYVKDSQSFKYITARLPFNLYEISVTSPMVENLYNIVMILIDPHYFSSIIGSKVFVCDS